MKFSLMNGAIGALRYNPQIRDEMYASFHSVFRADQADRN